MFVVDYVQKNVCIAYSCFDFEQIPFPVQSSLCAWLAWLFLHISIFLGIQKTFSQHEFSGNESQWEHKWKFFSLSYKYNTGYDFCITAEAHCAVKVPYEQMRAVFYPTVCWLPGTIAMHLLFQQC